MRSGGEVGVGKDEECDRSPEGVVCCADSRKAPSVAGQVICFVSDLGREQRVLGSCTSCGVQGRVGGCGGGGKGLDDVAEPPSHCTLGYK